MSKKGGLFECGLPKDSEPMSTTIPEITLEDQQNYEWFKTKTAEAAFENNIPVEWFANLEKLRTFGLPTVAFPPRDNAATFKAITENIHTEYTKNKNPLPLRMFVADFKGMGTSFLADGPFATGKKMGNDYGVFIYDYTRNRTTFTPVDANHYKKMIKGLWKEIKEDEDDSIVVFWKGDGDYTNKDVVYGSVELKDRYLNEIEATEAIPAINGVYDYAKMKELYEDISGSVGKHSALQVGKMLMVPRVPVDRRREMERNWAQYGRSLAKVDLEKKNWGEDWVRRYHTGGIADSIKNVFSSGIENVGDTRNAIWHKFNNMIRDARLPAFGTKSMVDDYLDDADRPAADPLCLLLSEHTGVPCEQDAPWREDLFGPARMNYQNMFAALHMFLWRHGFDKKEWGDDQVFRMIHQAHKCKSIPMGKSDGPEFEEHELEEIGARWVPNRDLQDGDVFFKAGIPIKFSMQVRAGKDGAWVTYLFPLSSNKDGSTVFLTHDEIGDVTGLLIDKPVDAEGFAWKRIWQPIQRN